MDFHVPSAATAANGAILVELATPFAIAACSATSIGILAQRTHSRTTEGVDPLASDSQTATIATMRGKFLIIGIFGLAIVMACGAWWWTYQRSARCREFWGLDSAAAIRVVTDVVAMKLGSKGSDPDPTSKAIDMDGHTFPVARTINLVGRGGLLHAANSLIVDDSYMWDTGIREVQGQDTFEYAVRFRDGDRQATVLFDTTNGRIAFAEKNKVARLDDKIAKGWKSYLEKTFK